jgi:hypothetical protein
MAYAGPALRALLRSLVPRSHSCLRACIPGIAPRLLVRRLLSAGLAAF